jgi:hypothetical protein
MWQETDGLENVGVDWSIINVALTQIRLESTEWIQLA